MPPPLACCMDDRISLLQLCLMLRANLRPLMMRERYECTQSLQVVFSFPWCMGFELSTQRLKRKLGHKPLH